MFFFVVSKNTLISFIISMYKRISTIFLLNLRSGPQKELQCHFLNCSILIFFLITWLRISVVRDPPDLRNYRGVGLRVIVSWIRDVSNLGPYPVGFRIRIGSGFNQVSDSVYGFRIGIQAKMTHESEKKIRKFHVLRCWMFFFESWRLFLLLGCPLLGPRNR